MKCANRPSDFIPSSFFPAGNNEALRQRSPLTRQHSDGVVLEPVNFPPTKTVLWNRTPQGPQEALQLTSQKNIPLFINEKTLWLAHRHCSQISSPFECFLVGNISVNSKQDGVDLIIDRFDPGRDIFVKTNGTSKVKRKVPTTIVPGDHILPVTLVSGLSGAENSVTHSKTEFQNSLKVLHSRISSRDPLNLSNLLTFKACCHIHGSKDEVIYNLHCSGITMATSILAMPVCSVPIIPTALARNLSGPLRLSEVQGTPKCGFLTMDPTRKLLLLLESDPKAYSLPLVGIWVSGVYNIHHPYIWACCLRYLQSSAVKERVFAPPSSFLLLLYSPVSAAPEFWECTQEKDQCNGDMFQLYSCNDNIHVEVPPNTKSSEPLCFELLPANDGMNRVLFQEAVGSWVQEQEPQSPGAAVPTAYPDSMSEPSNQEGRTEPETEEEHTPLPRPSPSPHPQGRQHQFDLSTIPEVSLSLSFDEEFLQDDQPRTLGRKGHTTHQPKNLLAPQQPRQQHSRDITGQENVGFLPKNRHHVQHGIRQVMTPSRPTNSPSRAPLKQVMSPNQIGMPRQPLQMNTKRQSAAPAEQRRSEFQKRNDTHRKYAVSPQGSRQLQNGGAAQKMGSSSNSPTDAAVKRRARSSSLPHASEGSSVVERENDQIQQRRMSVDEVYSDTVFSSFEAGKSINTVTDPKSQIQEQSGSAELADETDCSALSQNAGTEMESGFFQQNRGEHSKSESPRVKIDQQQGKQYLQHPQVGEGQQERKANQYESNDRLLDLTSSGSKPCSGSARAESCPNPYELLMEQQKQLVQLQAQIQLLLKQQNSTLPTPEVLLTPPRTPAPASDQDNVAESHDRAAAVSVCTNTGASLLLSTPAKDPGKKSAATSPLPARPCSRCDRVSRRSPEKSQQKKKVDSHSVVESPPESCRSDHITESSHDDSTTSLNEDENLTVMIDDPSHSLASSLNAVDIQSFYGSPSPQRKPNSSSGAGLDFMSPVLGESASVVLEHGRDAKQKTSQGEGDENKSLEDEHMHPDSLLHRNEREFYDNLLSQVKHLLEKQNDGPADESMSNQESAGPADTDNQAEAIHKPTPEEVALATAEELEKLVNPVLPSGTLFKSVRQERQLSLIQFSASPSVLATHPRINYVSIAVDETMDEAFSEADNIALKYLTEQQLSELHRQTNQRGRSVRFNNNPTSRGRVPHGNPELRTIAEHDTTRNVSVVGGSDYTWNNLSFATRNYLGKYHLAPAGVKYDEEERTQNVGVPSDKQDQGPEKVTDGGNQSVVSQPCSAPPSTPEPNYKEKTSNILDIGRLKKLPKLF